MILESVTESFSEVISRENFWMFLKERNQRLKHFASRCELLYLPTLNFSSATFSAYSRSFDFYNEFILKIDLFKCAQSDHSL